MSGSISITRRRRRAIAAWAAVAVVLAGFAVVAVPNPAVAAATCTPQKIPVTDAGQPIPFTYKSPDGCLPTSEQCSTGEFNGYWDGGEQSLDPTKLEFQPGRLAVCSGGGGMNYLYVAGTPSPTCGAVEELGQPSQFDPNECFVDWPAGVRVVHTQVQGYQGEDGTAPMLDGWILLPSTPATNLPVFLDSEPYFGQVIAPGYQNNHSQAMIDPIPLLNAGYAVAQFNIRGTGDSGGCYEWMGHDEQQDQKILVDYLGTQPWSNGKVAMGGLSMASATAWEAAINRPAHLTTVVSAGQVAERYMVTHTPEGLTTPVLSSTDPEGPYFPDYIAHQSIVPPVIGSPSEVNYWLLDHAPVAAERFCADVAQEMAELHLSGLQTDRNGPFWEERNLLAHFADVRVPAFFTHGFLDPGNYWADDVIWNALTNAPKRMMEGQWGHRWPAVDGFETDSVIPWLDHWMKGTKGSAGTGVVDYQDSDMTWHHSRAWPPNDAHNEVMYLAGAAATTCGQVPGGYGGTPCQSLQPTPAAVPLSPSFQSVPNAHNQQYGNAHVADRHILHLASALCPTDTEKLTNTGGLLYVTSPLAQPATIAGNPFAYLDLTSDQPGGQLFGELVDLGPAFTCDANGDPTDSYALAEAGADLNFWHGNYVADPFSTTGRTGVRMDFSNLAEVVPAGHRIAVLFGYGEDDAGRWGQPYTPLLTLHDDGVQGLAPSHVVLPLVSGDVGGKPPTFSYPPRPFAPGG